MKLRRVLGFMILAMAFVFGIAGTTTPDAEAKTKSLTFVQGYSTTLTPLFGKLKSVKTSKSAVVSAKKSGSKFTLTANKPGSAKITVKTTRGTTKYNIKVKALKLQCKVESVKNVNGYLSALISVVNKTGEYLSYADIDYVVKDASGTLKRSSYLSATKLVPNVKTYCYVYCSDGASIEVAQNGNFSASPGYKRKTVTKKVKVTSSGKVGGTIKVTFKSSLKKSVCGAADVVFYDASGNVVDVYTVSQYLYSKKKSGTSKITYFPSYPAKAVSYKVVNKRAYSEDYTGF